MKAELKLNNVVYVIDQEAGIILVDGMKYVPEVSEAHSSLTIGEETMPELLFGKWLMANDKCIMEDGRVFCKAGKWYQINENNIPSYEDEGEFIFHSEISVRHFLTAGAVRKYFNMNDIRDEKP
jgi:hypothetical protein